MSRDRLFLIEPGFEDAKKDAKTPGRRYYCPHCNQIEGVLATNPALAGAVEVIRVPFPRPRQPVIAVVGEANQGLPLLVLGDGKPAPDDAQTFGGARFISDTTRILELLADRHGIPYPH